MEQVLADAKYLAQRLHHHDSAADALIGDASNLEIKLQAMKEYREEVTKLNDIAKHRPRSTLILGSQLENQRICDLENENRELHIALADHQSTLELIMNKYREQVLNLLTHKGLDKSAMEQINRSSGDISALKEKVTEMAAVMHKAVEADVEIEKTDVEILTKLKYENNTLRELLNISGHPKKEIEKIQMKERLNDVQMVNGGMISPECEDHVVYSSGEEIENHTGTVKRRFKGQLNQAVNNGEAVSSASEDSTNGMKENVERVYEKVPMAVTSSVTETVNSSSEDSREAGRKSGLDDEDKDMGSPFSTVSNVKDEEAPSKDSKDNIEAAVTPDAKSADSPFTAVPGNTDWGLKRRKQEEILELYNSEGILLEDGEEGQGGKSADSKMGGFKIRRSNKQKKVIQADLKSFFGNEEETDDKPLSHESRRKESGNEAGEGLDLKTDTDMDSGSSTVEEIDGIDLSMDVEIMRAMNNVEETSKHEKLMQESLRDSLSPTDSPIESPVESPDHGDYKHKIMALNYSDSDSDDPEMMVEDAFADVIEEASDSDSSTEGSGLEPDIDEDEPTEEELIGDLGEGGEYAMSRWVNPVEDFHIMENGDKSHDDDLLAGEQQDGKSQNEGEFSIPKGGQNHFIPDGQNSRERQGNQDFPFSEAYVQMDQFTGGSIEAKFAKRKRYKNGSRASAITLFAGNQEGAIDSPRSNIRSDSELTTNNGISAGNNLAKSSSDPSASNAAQSSSPKANIAQGSASPGESSSGEIDPTVYKSRLSAAPQGDEAHSKMAKNLTNLLSDLDAALDLQDSD